MKRLLLVAMWVFAAGGCLGDGAVDTSQPATSPSTLTTIPPFDPTEWAATSLALVAAEGIDSIEPSPVPVGVAPGLPVSADGLILTAASAVVGADRVNVWLPGAEFPVSGTIEAEAACSNLALVAVAEEVTPVTIGGSAPHTAVWFDGQEIRTAAYREDGSFPPGTVVLNETGDVVGVWHGLVSDARLTHGSRVIDVLDAMRRRDLVAELGVVAHDAGDGSLTVIAVDSQAQTSLLAGDVITSLGDAPASLEALCAEEDRDGMTVEVIREGRRHVGTFTSGLRLASARNQEQIKDAVVRIDTDQDGDGIAESATGTGFFISEDGKIVTNHHVIAGQPATGGVEVRIDGGEPHPATIIGRSSCNDLAVLDITGTGYSYLEWSPDPLVLEMPVRSVGFPAGTATITFQSGQVSKEIATVYRNSALLDHFEHSAQIIGGNSGGPMLNEVGEVVGVTVAQFQFGGGDDEEYAIAGSQARAVVEDLLAGDVETLGMHLDLSSGWFRVGALDPGGQATSAGLAVGDWIYRWGDQIVGDPNYTSRGFCQDYLDRSSEGAILEVGVDRGDEYFDGDFFGSITEVPDPIFVADDSGLVGAVLPGRWTDFQPIESDESNDWIGFRAAPSVDRFLNEAFGSNAGTRILVSADEAARYTTDERLLATNYGGCVDEGVEPAAPTSWLSGHVRTYRDCHGTRSMIRSYALMDTSQTVPVMVLVLITEMEFEMPLLEFSLFENFQVARWPGSPEPGA